MASTALDAKVYRPPDSSTGTVTSWIPLITPYSMYVEECTSAFWRWRDGGTPVAWDPGYGISVDPNLRCVPEAVTTWWDQNLLGSNTETVVSIGPLSCPDPFTQAATHVEDASSTRIACCPSGYTFSSWQAWGQPQQCYSKVDSGAVLTFQTSNSNKAWSPTTSTTNSSATVLAVHINGWIFAEETGAPDSSTESGTSSCSPCGEALSTGDKVGIGVGVSLGVAGLAALAAGLFMMRRSRKIQRPTQASLEQPMRANPQIQGTYGPSSVYTHASTELHGSHGMALEGRHKAPPSELPSVYS